MNTRVGPEGRAGELPIGSPARISLTLLTKLPVASVAENEVAHERLLALGKVVERSRYHSGMPGSVAFIEYESLNGEGRYKVARHLSMTH